MTIPEGVTIIESSTFQGCSSLASVTIPNSVTRIRYTAFERCSSLASVTIPDSVTRIGRSAFEGCSSLTSITFEGDAPDYESDSFKGLSPDAKIIIRPGATGFGVSFAGLRVEILERPPVITSGRMDSKGNFIISVEGKLEGVKVMYSLNLKSGFKEVSTETKKSENQLIVPASAPELQGPQGFFLLKETP